MLKSQFDNHFLHGFCNLQLPFISNQFSPGQLLVSVLFLWKLGQAHGPADFPWGETNRETWVQGFQVNCFRHFRLIFYHIPWILKSSSTLTLGIVGLKHSKKDSRCHYVLVESITRWLFPLRRTEFRQISEIHYAELRTLTTPVKKSSKLLVISSWCLSLKVGKNNCVSIFKASNVQPMWLSRRRILAFQGELK